MKTKEEIENLFKIHSENEILIAKFMNLDILYDGMVKHKSVPSNLVTSTKYSESWDWLMDVVEKIESLGHVFIIDGLESNIMKKNDCDMGLVLVEGKTKLEAVYLSVLEYIEWYNDNKK